MKVWEFNVKFNKKPSEENMKILSKAIIDKGNACDLVTVYIEFNKPKYIQLKYIEDFNYQCLLTKFSNATEYDNFDQPMIIFLSVTYVKPLGNEALQSFTSDSIKYCSPCGKYQPIKHECFIEPTQMDLRFIFYDLEIVLKNGVEEMETEGKKVFRCEPSLCVAQEVCSICIPSIDDKELPHKCSYCKKDAYVFTHNPVSQLLDLSFKTKNRKYKTICLTNNAENFGAQFIQNYIMCNIETKYNFKVHFSKGILAIHFQDKDVIFLDASKFLGKSSVFKLNKDYDLGPSVITFPLLFTKFENQNSSGKSKLPSLKDYHLDYMEPEERKSFEEWYNMRKEDEDLINFEQELIEQCKKKVKILKESCLIFRKIFKEAADLDPFNKHFTLAQACLAAFRKKFLKKKSTISVIPLIGYSDSDEPNKKASLNPQDAFFRGRNENIVNIYDAKENQKIKYLDFISCYPYICKRKKFPVGHPKVTVGIENCKKIDISNVEGLIKCEVEPPNNLYFPVLPIRINDEVFYPLCRKCCEDKLQIGCPHDKIEDRKLSGTWVSDELKKAKELGYKIIQVSEIWQYNTEEYFIDESMQVKHGILSEYIDKFFIQKTYGSGFPSDCKNDDDKKRYVQKLENAEGITLDIKKIKKNVGLEKASKSCLNILWGKLCQKDFPKTEILRDRQQFDEIFKKIKNEGGTIDNILPIKKDTVYLKWTNKSPNAFSRSPSNSVIGAYITAQGRLKLYEHLEKLDERVLYYDTDSIIYVCNEGVEEYNPPTGDLLGDLRDELKTGDYITSFISLRPQVYAYKTNKDKNEEDPKCKIRSVPKNDVNKKIVNYNSLRKLINGEIVKLEPKTQIIKPDRYHNVSIRLETRIITSRRTDKRRFVHGLDKSYPYGYKCT